MEMFLAQFKSDIVKLLLFSAVTLFILGTAFFKEPFLSLLFLTTSAIFVFILPGFWWAKILFPKENFLETVVASTVFSTVIVGAGTYYLGLLGITLNISSITLPLVSIIISFFLYYKSGILFQQKT